MMEESKNENVAEYSATIKKADLTEQWKRAKQKYVTWNKEERMIKDGEKNIPGKQRKV